MFPPKVYTWPFSKLHSISEVTNLRAQNNISYINKSSQISLQNAAINCNFSDILTPLGVTFILLPVVPHEGLASFICEINCIGTVLSVLKTYENENVVKNITLFSVLLQQKS